MLVFTDSLPGSIFRGPSWSRSSSEGGRSVSISPRSGSVSLSTDAVVLKDVRCLCDVVPVVYEMILIVSEEDSGGPWEG